MIDTITLLIRQSDLFSYYKLNIYISIHANKLLFGNLLIFLLTILKPKAVKQLKILSALCIASVFLFSSCGEGDEKTTDTTETTDSIATTSTMPESTMAASTIDTTPQTFIVVRHKVADYAKWKPGYEGHDSMRLASGIHSYAIGRGLQDSNTVLVATKADDVAKAKAFVKDPSLKAAMQKGGVIGTPSISLNTAVYQDTSPAVSDLRSITNFTVKDWDAWRKAFESNRQIRIDNGLSDRAYGYDVDDNHKVTLVLAINDSAKAFAYFNSDLLKQKRAEGGVVGEVKRFIYRIVQRY